MRIAGVVIGTVFVLATMPSPGSGSVGARPDACKLLRAALKGSALGLRTPNRAPGSTRVNCEYDDGKEPGPDRHWWAHFNGLLPQPSTGEAKRQWEALWKGWKGTRAEGVSVYRLRGYGADDAFAVESTHDDPRATDTIVWWRKGRHFGILEIGGLGQIGDVEDAEALLKRLMGGVPSG